MPSGGLPWTPGNPNAPFIPVWPVVAEPQTPYNVPTCPGPALFAPTGCTPQGSPLFNTGQPWDVGRRYDYDSVRYKVGRAWDQAGSALASVPEKAKAFAGWVWRGVTNPLVRVWREKGLGRLTGPIQQVLENAWSTYKSATAPLVERLMKAKGMSQAQAQAYATAIFLADMTIVPGPGLTALTYARTQRAIAELDAKVKAAEAAPPYPPTTGSCCFPQYNYQLNRSFPWARSIYDDQLSPREPMSVHFRSCPRGPLAKHLSPPCEGDRVPGCNEQLAAAREAFTTQGSLDPIALARETARRTAERLGLRYGIWVRQEGGVPVVIVTTQTAPPVPVPTQESGVLIRWVQAPVVRS